MTGQRTTPTDGRGLLAYQKRKGREIDEDVKLMKMRRRLEDDAVVVREIDVVQEMMMMDAFGRGRGWGFLRVSVKEGC